MRALVLLPAAAALTHKTFTVTAPDGYALSVMESRDTATEDAVLLLHGRTWSSGPVYGTTGAIDALGRAAYAMDFRGFGRTQERAADGLLKPSTCAEDVRCVLEALREKHSAVHVVGWSYGGLVAQLVAAGLCAGSDACSSSALVDRLVLYASVWDGRGGYCDDAGPYAAPVPRGTQTYEDCVSDFGIPGSISDEDARAFGEATLKADPSCVDWTRLCEFEVDLGLITCPTLVIHGDVDPYAGAEDQRGLLAGLGSADKRLVVVPGSDHVAHALTEPKLKWGAALRAFFDEGR